MSQDQDIGRIEIEIVPTDDPSKWDVKASVAVGGNAYTKKEAMDAPATKDNCPYIVICHVNRQLLDLDPWLDFLTDPAAHADPIEPSRDAEGSWGCGEKATSTGAES